MPTFPQHNYIIIDVFVSSVDGRGLLNTSPLSSGQQTIYRGISKRSRQDYTGLRLTMFTTDSRYHWCVEVTLSLSMTTSDHLLHACALVCVSKTYLSACDISSVLQCICVSQPTHRGGGEWVGGGVQLAYHTNWCWPEWCSGMNSCVSNFIATTHTHWETT